MHEPQNDMFHLNAAADSLLSIVWLFAYVQVKAAHVAHLKLRTMRHPNILKYVDGIEVRPIQSVGL